MRGAERAIGLGFPRRAPPRWIRPRNHFFLAKMGVLAVILLLEIWPMVTLIRWRTSLRRGVSPDAVAVPETARRIALLSQVQGALVVLMLLFAVAMARGLGATPGG